LARTSTQPTTPCNDDNKQYREPNQSSINHNE